jgi:hypothetical protein
MVIMVNEEREAILRMVADQTISVEQGLELLEAIEPEQAARPPRMRGFAGLIDEALGKRFDDRFRSPGPPPPPRPPRPPHPPRPPQWGPRPSPGGAGRHGLRFEDLVELKTNGVSKTYIEEIRDLFPDVDLGELLECRESGVTPGFARDMLATFAAMDVSDLIEMRIHGVTTEFVAALRSKFPDLDPAQIIEAVVDGVKIGDLEFFMGQAGSARHHGPADAGGSHQGDRSTE